MKHIKYSGLAALLLASGLPAAAWAQQEVNQDPPKAAAAATINVNENEAVVEVHGVVCSFCSKGVQSKLAKLGFVDTARYLKGTLVEIEKQRVTIAIKAGQTFDVSAVFRAIREGGYDPVVAYVRAGSGATVTHRAEGE